MEHINVPDACQIQPNPDIIGVGIRLSIYLLALLGPTLSHFLKSAELAQSFQSSIGVTGLALFLTTVIYTAQDSLDLFHAICIFHLLGLAGITVSAKGKYRKGPIRTAIFAVSYTLVLTGYLVWLVYVFTVAPKFGATPECNKYIVYVIFGTDIHATNDVFRWILVAGFGLMLLVLAITVAVQSFVFCRVIRKPQTNAVTSEDEDEIRRLPYHLFGHWAGSAYIIAMLELIIKRNSLQPGIGQWTFGQLLAMVMLVGPVIEIAALLLGELDLEGRAGVGREFELAPRA